MENQVKAVLEEIQAGKIDNCGAGLTVLEVCTFYEHAKKGNNELLEAINAVYVLAYRRGRASRTKK